MIAFEIHSKGAQESLTILGAHLEDLTKPITEVLQLGLQDARSQIGAQGTMFGGAWVPMSPLTPIVAQKLYNKVRAPGTLLNDEGSLLDSLTPDGSANIFFAGPVDGYAGSALVSARTGFGIAVGQQRGTSRTFHVLQGRGFSEPGIPARPFLSWHEERGEEYVGIFARYVMEGVE